MLLESHNSSKRVEEYLFGTEQEQKDKVKSRAQHLDSFILGVKAGKLGYRIVLGIAALLVAVGTLWSTMRGLK